MNYSIRFSPILFVALIASELRAGLPEPTISERGPHHRVWQRISQRTRGDGNVILQTNSYVELATGMHYQEDGQWVESKEEIELLPGGTGAIARQGQHQVTFATNINTAGAIDLLAADGKRFRSHILGLAYTDAATGNAVMIAEVKDSIGLLVAPNQVVYPDAFTDIQADIRYTYTRSGFEQDIILREKLPSPELFQLNPATTRLESYSEWLSPPTPVKEAHIIKRESNPAVRAAMAEPDLIDEYLQFGAMSIGNGTAFPLNHEGGPGIPRPELPVGKSWEQREGRHLLIEKVEYPSIEPYLRALPESAALHKAREGLVKSRISDAKRLVGLFGSRPPPSKQNAEVMRMASMAKRDGFVLDYLLMSTSTNFTFQADATYFISGSVGLSGTTTIEGGTVIKYTNWSGSSVRLNLLGPIRCNTASWHPAILTGKDDDSVGEVISGSSGNPHTNFYCTSALDFTYPSAAFDLHDLRFWHLVNALKVHEANTVSLKDSQIYRGDIAIDNKSSLNTSFRNVLFHGMNRAFFGTVSAVTICEHLTISQVGTLILGTNLPDICLTNSLLIAVTNGVRYAGSNVETNLDGTGIFQTLGAANHYLANNSPYRNAGTTNINSDLLAALKKRTTYPPILLTNPITANTILSPQVPRATGLPTLGYHYDPLDFVLYKVALTNATLTITNGAAIGIYGGSSDYGLWLNDGGNLVCEGTPTNLCRIVRYNLVQEQANTNWSSSSVGITIKSPNWEASPSPTARFRFTDFAMPANGAEHFYGATGSMAAVVFQDCQLLAGRLYSDLPGFAFTNCLFERVSASFYGAGSEHHNNLFHGGSISFDASSGTNNFVDNFFDGTTLAQSDPVVHSYNAYSTNATRLAPTNANDVVWTNVTYETGSLGFYYVPTNSPLRNAGSQNATNAGLYHFTTTTNQVKETNSVLDIGFHWIALTNGVPLDADGDGLADWIEDTNGNGSKETTESDWNDSDTDDDGVSDYLEFLQGRNPLVGSVADTNGVIKLQIYTPLK